MLTDSVGQEGRHRGDSLSLLHEVWALTWEGQNSWEWLKGQGQESSGASQTWRLGSAGNVDSLACTWSLCVASFSYSTVLASQRKLPKSRCTKRARQKLGFLSYLASGVRQPHFCYIQLVMTHSGQPRLKGWGITLYLLEEWQGHIAEEHVSWKLCSHLMENTICHNTRIFHPPPPTKYTILSQVDRRMNLILKLFSPRASICQFSKYRHVLLFHIPLSMTDITNQLQHYFY